MSLMRVYDFPRTTTRRTAITAAGLILVLIQLFSSAAGGETLPAERHPSLLFSADQIPILKKRIQREPYATWWHIVRTRAESTPSSFSDERSKARFAKSLSFAYLMTDNKAFGQRAVELLKDIRFPPRGGDLGEPHNEGEVVALYAVSYDMIHSFVETDDTSLQEIRTILAEEAARLRKGIVILEIKVGFLTRKIRLHESLDPRDVSLSTVHLDNWHVRAYGGLGLAALVLSDHADATDWATWAFDLVTRSLAHQIEETDGGYAEGPGYSRYAADVYLPYMYALLNLQGINLFANAKVQKMHDWLVNIRLPNGRRPNIDDSHIDDFYGHYLAAVDEDGGVHRWDWEKNSNGQYVREFSEMDAIALYDDSVAAEEPNHGPTVFMPGAGDAVFRSDWSPEATYLLLRGEHGRVREQGLGHEHPDETSFVLYAGGEMLALDSGYINWVNHSKVNQGRNHNVILIDGAGPPLTTIMGEPVDGGNDAFIEQYFTSKFMDYAEVRAGYRGVGIRRRVMFPYRKYFVVADELTDDQTHRYEFRLHGHGGGSSGGSYTRQGSLARWGRTGVELLAYMPPKEGLKFSERDTLHSFAYLQEPTHTVLRVEQSGDNAEFLTMLYPHNLDQPEPAFSQVTAQGGQVAEMVLDDVKDVAWVQEASSESIIFESPAGALSSNGRFGFVHTEHQELAGFNVQDGSYLTVGGVPIFKSAQVIDFSLEMGDTLLEGFVRGPGSGYELAIALARSVDSLTFGGTPIEMSSHNDNILTLGLSGEGFLRLTSSAGADSNSQLLIRAVVGSKRYATQPALIRVDRTVRFDVFEYARADSSDTSKVSEFTLSADASLGHISGTTLRTSKTAGIEGTVTIDVGNTSQTFAIETIPSSIVGLTLKPEAANIAPGEVVDFNAFGVDKFGNVFNLQGVNVGWHVVPATLGKINNRTGLFTAGTDREEGYVIAAVNRTLKFGDTVAEVSGSRKVVVSRALPWQLELTSVRPNPFNASTTVSFSIPHSSYVRLVAYNSVGQVVSTLVDTHLEAGKHEIVWTADEIPTGLYVLKLDDSRHTRYRKALLLR